MYCIVDGLGMTIYVYPAPGGVLEVQGLPVTSRTALLVPSYFKADLGFRPSWVKVSTNSEVTSVLVVQLMEKTAENRDGPVFLFLCRWRPVQRRVDLPIHVRCVISQPPISTNIL